MMKLSKILTMTQGTDDKILSLMPDDMTNHNALEHFKNGQNNYFHIITTLTTKLQKYMQKNVKMTILNISMICCR